MRRTHGWKIAVVGVALLALAACQPAASTPDAATSQVNASHTGHSSQAVRAGASERWRASVPGFLWHGSATAGSRVFAAAGSYNEGGTGYTSEVVALSKQTGKVLWVSSVSPAFQQWVAAEGDAVFTLDGDGNLQRLDAATGEREWITGFRGTSDAVPVPFQGRLYVAHHSGGGIVTAFDQATGRVRWSTEVEKAGALSPPTVREDGVYVTGACGNTYKLRLGDGKLLWHHDGACFGVTRTPAVVAANRVWWTDGGGPKPILDANTGKQTGWWQGGACTPIVTDREFVVWGDVLEAHDPNTGRLLWSRDVVGERFANCPLSAGRNLYFINRAGRLVTIDRGTGRTVSRVQLADLSPADARFSPLAEANVGGGLALIPIGDQLIAIG